MENLQYYFKNIKNKLFLSQYFFNHIVVKKEK